MDFSAPPETQQQQQQEQQQSFYPAQANVYDAYYGYHQQQHYDASASHHQYCYPPEYATAYHQQQHPAAAPQDSSATSALHTGTSQGTHHQGIGAPGATGYAQDGQESYSVPPGLNPAAAAAVAALSQLSHLAGTMDAAERAMVGTQGRQWHGKGAPGTMGQMAPPSRHHHWYSAQYGGMRPGAGGRRGGRPSRGGRGGGRANLGHYSHGPAGVSHVRGRGRGAHRARGGGRRSHQSAKTSATESESAEVQVSGPTPALPRQPRLPIAWCDICRVDCNSLEILEQHKNGKRHKRTVQRFEEIQAQQKLFAEAQAQATMQAFDGTMTQPQHMAESQEGVIKHPEIVVQVAEENTIIQVDEEIKASTVSKNSQEASAFENKMKTELQGQVVDEQKVSAATEGIVYLPPIGGPTRGRPPKRKMIPFGRGGKRSRYLRPMENGPQERVKKHHLKEQRPKEPPRVCTLCNVMCETQVVFDSHIAGKKHTSKINKFRGNAVYGPLEVYIPPNQPTAFNPPGLQPLFFGFKTQEMIQLAAQGPSSLTVCGPHQPEQDEAAVSVDQAEQIGCSQDSGTRDQEVVTTELMADVAVTAGENVAVETQAACTVTELLSTEAETAFEVENAVEQETSFAIEEGALEAEEAPFTAGDTDAQPDAV